MNSNTLPLTKPSAQYRPINPGISREPCCDFDWHGIPTATNEQDDESKAVSREQVATVLKSVLDYITAPADARQGDAFELAGRRAVCLRRALDAGAFGKFSLRELSRQLGAERMTMQRLTRAAQSAFKLKPETQGTK